MTNRSTSSRDLTGNWPGYSYESQIRSEMGRHDQGEVPGELGRLKQKYLEFLEIAATEQQENLKGTFIQQAIDN